MELFQTLTISNLFRFLALSTLSLNGTKLFLTDDRFMKNLKLNHTTCVVDVSSRVNVQENLSNQLTGEESRQTMHKNACANDRVLFGIVS